MSDSQPPVRQRQKWQPLRQISRKSAAFAKKIWRNADIRKPESWLSTFVNLLMRIGTLLLIVTLAILVWRTFRNEGCSIEPFSMPKNWEENGFNGDVMARQLLDEYQYLKAVGRSVKQDNISAEGPDNTELNVAVMGLGISLRSIAFHLRELLGRPNQVVRNALMQTDSQLVLQVRMSGYPMTEFREPLQPNAEQSLRLLLRKAAGEVLGRTDPYRMMLYLMRKQDYAGAENLLDQMQRDPKGEQQWTFFGRGVLAETRNQPREAIRHYLNALNIQPDFEMARHNLAQQYINIGQYDQAQALMEKSVQANPNDTIAHNALGFIYYQFKRFPESDAAFERVAQISGNHPLWLINWISAIEQRGDSTKLQQVLDQKIALQKDSANYYWLQGYKAQYRKDYDAAATCFSRSLELQPYNLTIRHALVQYAFYKKEYPKVIELGRKVQPDTLLASARARTAEIYNFTAMAYNYTGQPAPALEMAQKCIKIIPNSGYPYSTLAEIYGVGGDVINFYRWLEVAFQKGLPVQAIDEQFPPYDRFKNDPRYRQLKAKYSTDKASQ
jgi:tetratricopeptide (TPR) repeat protein